MTAEDRPVRLAILIGLIAAVLLAAVCGWLGYRTEDGRRADRDRALLVEVARQGAVNLTTIDYRRAESDVQRILDSATGDFRDDFQSRSGPFIDVVKQAKSTTTGTVTEAGLESQNGQEGRVLVAVSVKTVSDGKAEPQPRYWRMRMTVQRDGGGAKVSGVDFVP